MGFFRETSDRPNMITLTLTDPPHQELHQLLLALNQSHLFEGWEPNSPSIPSFFEQIDAFHSSYPGGLPKYIEKAQALLRDAEQGANPFAGMSPRVPDGENLEHMSEQFFAAERAGIAASGQAAFVLVAGGMGERLGYDGIKVSLPSETTSNVTFLELYLQSIMAMQAKSTSSTELHIPLGIMTSAETHEKTVALLESNNYFGFPRERLFLMKQDKVPCLSDAQGTLTRDPENPYRLLTKPHGHGDVHYLLHQTGVAKQWREEGRKWIAFFQDTNGLVFRSMCASLGVSVIRNFDSNSITGPRKAKQAMGAICKLIKDDGTFITTNVEYNLLDPMLRASPALYPDGDVNDSATGFSPFPGNMNQLIFKLSTYVDTLNQHMGLVPEFVNPKYKDETRTSFKKPTRLECMMQDLPRQFTGEGAAVGFTSILGSVAFYNPVKNHVVDAYKKQDNGVSPACAASGEHLMYANTCQTLSNMGVNVEVPLNRTCLGGIEVQEWSRIILPPHMSMTAIWLRDVFPEPSTVTISQRSTLLVVGKGRVILRRVTIDGTLVVRVPNEDDVVELQDMAITNKGWSFVPLTEHGMTNGSSSKVEQMPESLKIRGYTVHRSEQCTVVANTAGRKELEKDTAHETLHARPSSSSSSSSSMTPDVAVVGGIVVGNFNGTQLISVKD